MEITSFVVFGLLGVAVGSFINVCIDRLPAGGSLISPPSRCDTCQRRLSPLDLVPVVSYLCLRGRCRYCGARIPVRVILVELLSCGLFLLAFWRFGLSIEFVVTAFWSCIFLVIMLIDWERQLILNKVTYPMALVALVMLASASVVHSPTILGDLYFLPEPIILGGIIGGLVGFVFFLIIFIINPRGIGAGDIKLAGLIGLVTGFPFVIMALFIGIFIGGIVAISLLLLKMKGRKDVIPYGTFLSIGPIITLLWGNQILSWYLGYF